MKMMRRIVPEVEGFEGRERKELEKSDKTEWRRSEK